MGLLCEEPRDWDTPFLWPWGGQHWDFGLLQLPHSHLVCFWYSMILVCLQSVLVLPFCLKATFCDSWVWSQLWSLFIELLSSLWTSCGHFYRSETGTELREHERTGENLCSFYTSFLSCSYNHLTIQLHEVGPFHIWWTRWQIHTSHWPGGQWPFSTWMCT